MRLTLAAVVVLAVCNSSSVASGQTPQTTRRLVGQMIGAHWQLDAKGKLTVETATLTFKDSDGRPAVTVDFVARYATERPRNAPTVVDMIVTELSSKDDTPQMTMRVDGEPLPIIGRLRSRRSAVATMPFEDFVRLTNAERIVEQAFDTELEFGRGQMAMLRSTAAKWVGR